MEKSSTPTERITMLGTGNAFVTKCFNTCFVLDSGSSRLLVDAGGGNGILSRLEEANISLTSLHDLYLTHAHTDHVMGAVWVVRAVVNAAKKSCYEGVLRVWGNERVLYVLQTMCSLMFSAKDQKVMSERIAFQSLTSGQEFTVGGMRFTVFDIHSTKEKQFGFRSTLPSKKTLVCLGDEPYNQQNHDFAVGADYLMSEAFCLYADREEFHPYEKNHSTALDAAQLAEELKARNLILYHTEDKTLKTRKETYTAEARSVFNGNIYVPNDLETIEL